jgi:hypothetical protein
MRDDYTSAVGPTGLYGGGGGGLNDSHEEHPLGQPGPGGGGAGAKLYPTGSPPTPATPGKPFTGGGGGGARSNGSSEELNKWHTSVRFTLDGFFINKEK